MQNIDLPLTFFREGKYIIGYCPALDVASHGSTLSEARRMVREAIGLVVEELVKRGTLKDALLELGWEKHAKKWSPPEIIAQEETPVSFPIAT